MASKEYLEEQVRAWDGVNKYLADDARGLLKDGIYDKPKDSKKDYNYYKRKTVKELRVIAKKLEVHNYYKLREDEIIKQIMK